MSRLDFLSAGAAESVVRRVADQMGIDVAGHFGPVGGNRDRLVAGEDCDVVILTAPMIEALQEAGQVAAEEGAVLGRVATALAVCQGAPRPEIGDERSLRLALLGASAVFFPDPASATAGRHFAKTLRALDVMDKMQSRLRVQAGGALAMAALAESSDPGAIGCTQTTEIRATAGVDLVGPLPSPHGLISVYAAGVAAQAKNPDLARRFLARLGGVETKAIRAEAGFEI